MASDNNNNNNPHLYSAFPGIEHCSSALGDYYVHHTAQSSALGDYYVHHTAQSGALGD
jgi:hypothetical protein